MGGCASAPVQVPSEMKAWRVHAYGEGGDPADAIGKMKLETVPVPNPKSGQVLIKVEFAAVNPIDWKLLSGGFDGLCPVCFPYTPGFDIAGTVAKLGEGVSGLKVGDKVCADIGLVESCTKETALGPAGAFAEYACALAGTVSKVGSVPLQTAVILPLVGQTSYQALFTGDGKTFAGEHLGQLKAGEKLLVLGGATAAGIFAIQLAKNVGASVDCTASSNKMPDGTSKLDYCKKLGAGEVVDYKTKDWSEVLAGKNYDLIYDCGGTAEDWTKASTVLKKGGTFVSIANFSGATSTPDHTFKNFLIKSSSKDLDSLLKLVSSGKLKPPLDSVVKFHAVPEVLKKSFSTQCAGKLVIQVTS